VTIVEFSDFQCPFCARAVPTLQELVRQYPKGVRWIFKNFPLDFHPESLLAHKAALAAGEQGRFWEMHDLIFGNQGSIKREDLLGRARQLGLDMNRFVADLDGDRFTAELNRDKAEAARLGVTGTPTFFINGKRMVGAWPLAEYKNLVETELSPARNTKALATATPKAKLPEVGKPTASPKPPSRSTLAPGATSKGPETAPVTITWYADLESPLSTQAAQIVRDLMDAYPSKIRTVFRNVPMEFHSHALPAHYAALAAGAEGKFWPMLDLILAHPETITREALIGYAQQLSLNKEKFIARLDGHIYQAMVDEDMAEAKKQGVYGVPAFFVNGRRIDGVQPLAVFRSVVEAELNQAQAGTAQ
jgi:protein-disulfide isomerase